MIKGNKMKVLDQSTQLVYRIEDRLGKGPYIGKTSAPNSWHRKSICNHNAEKRPGPYQCDIMREMSDYHLGRHHFAFSTMKQLERWFTKTDRELLHEDGYHISVYRVPREHYIRATNQCIFVRRHSELVETIYMKEQVTKQSKKKRK
jgi:hypothetical protein